VQIPLEKAWVIAAPVPEKIKKSLDGYSDLMQQLLFNRGIDTVEAARTFLDNDTDFHAPFLFKDMEKAVEKILDAINSGDRIAVFGDYDVDGISATVLLTQVLMKLGADVEPYIPERSKEGYGVNTYAIDYLKHKNVRLIITVDCGIRSVNELDYARSLGMSVIITDHHSTGELVPDVDAIICQHSVNEAYPEMNLSGVGLAYKLSHALLIRNPLEGVDITDWLDLAALGTVADVVPLVGENRKIVKAGIKKMKLASRIGLEALVNCSGKRSGSLVSTDISFVIAPRLNAAGRISREISEREKEIDEIEYEDFETVDVEDNISGNLTDKNNNKFSNVYKAFEILMTSDLNRAGMLAQELDDLNRKRQKETQEILDEAILLLEENSEENHLLLFTSHENFKPGLVGLVASKLTEIYYRPAVIGHTNKHTTRASCRSIPEFNIIRALDLCSDLLLQHGGHEMAAGFTVLNDKLPELKSRLEEIISDSIVIEDLKPGIQADIDIPLRKIPKDIIKDLDRLEPFGAANPGVLFVSRHVNVVRSRAVGRDQSHLKLSLRDGDVFYDAIAFNQGHWAKVLPDKIDMAYSIERNFYNGNIFMQLNIRDIKKSG
jgi:single-stranded-DNA-specific exonuclease